MIDPISTVLHSLHLLQKNDDNPRPGRKVRVQVEASRIKRAMTLAGDIAVQRGKGKAYAGYRGINPPRVAISQEMDARLTAYELMSHEHGTPVYRYQIASRGIELISWLYMSEYPRPAWLPDSITCQCKVLGSVK